MDVEHIETGSEIAYETISGTAPDGWNVANITFEACDFRNFAAASGAMTKCRFYECRLYDCDLSAVDLTDSKFSDVEFHDCKLQGVDWSSTAVSRLGAGLKFYRSNMKYSVFMQMNLRESVFEEVDLTESDFTDSDLRQSRFTGAVLSGARFSRADLREADLRNSVDYVIDFRATDLRNAKVSLPDAAALLAGIPVTVLDPFEDD